MTLYDINTDYLEIVSGTNNTTSPVYREAAKQLDNNNEEIMKSLKYFISSIESVANKNGGSDKRITNSKGNLRRFKSYDNINTIIGVLRENIGSVKITKDLVSLHDSIIKYQSWYTEGYTKDVRLITLEYENAVYLLVTGLAMAMAEYVDVVQSGSIIKIKKRSGSDKNSTTKVINKFSSILSSKDHQEYLEGLLKVKSEAPINTNVAVGESAVAVSAAISASIDLIWSAIRSVGKLRGFAVNAFKTIKRTFFGIIPLIRAIVYLRYKRKADTVLALEQQAQFVEQNIERLQNMKTIDQDKKEEMIKKQQAYVEQYKKKAAKLRAELIDSEREASEEIKKQDESMRNSKDDEDFIFENGISAVDIFFEKSHKIQDLTSEDDYE